MNGEFSRFTATSYTSTKKKGKNDRFSQAFHVVLNYWEIKPAQYEARMQDLAVKGITAVSAFVPWAHAETDIFHSLKKFVRAAWAAKLRVRLHVMPELGVNYPNAGFPKELLTAVANLAVDRRGRVIHSHAAPNIFPLPSLSAPEVLRRFGSYLIRVGSILAEVFAETGSSDFCEVIVSNSLFNYYRAHGLRGTEHGDYSAAQVMAFRDFIDREYRSPEGTESDAGEEQFKTQLYEGYNRHRFFTHVEQLLREKTDMVFTRKSSSCAVRHVDVFNPECCPDAAYAGLLTEIFDFRSSVQRYYGSIVQGGHRGEAIFLGNSGIFRRFTDQERSFLVLASLIHSGEVAVMAEDLLRLSANYRAKLHGLLDIIEQGKFSPRAGVAYVSASKFSMEARSFGDLSAMVPGLVSVRTGLDGQAKDTPERLVFLDPRSVVRSIEFVQGLALAQSGKVVAMPLPLATVPNYTAGAREHLERFRKGRQPLKINIGVSYLVYQYHLGTVVFYDAQGFWEDAPANENERRFFQALLGLAEVGPPCSVSDARLRVAEYVSADDPDEQLLFIVNPTDEEVSATLGFGGVVALAAVSGGDQSAGQVERIVGRSFELSVPSLGVISMRLARHADAEGVVRWT